MNAAEGWELGTIGGIALVAEAIWGRWQEAQEHRAQVEREQEVEQVAAMARVSREEAKAWLEGERVKNREAIEMWRLETEESR